MKLSTTDLKQLLALAMTAARRAAKHIQAEAGKHREVLHKDGGSSLASQMVTEVDLVSQRLILETLQESIARYALGLLTEESQDDASRHACDYFWCIDPLDGTLPFIENVAGYSVSIALVSRTGDPVIGVIHDPVTDTLYHAIHDGGAFRNGERLTIDTRSDNQALTLVMDRSFAKQAIYDQLLEQLARVAKEHRLNGVNIINQGGAAMNACWVLEHAPAVYFKFPKAVKGGGSVWDYAASACLFQELGGVVSDIHGESLTLNRKGTTFMNDKGIVYASSNSLGDAISALYRNHG